MLFASGCGEARTTGPGASKRDSSMHNRLIGATAGKASRKEKNHDSNASFFDTWWNTLFSNLLAGLLALLPSVFLLPQQKRLSMRGDMQAQVLSHLPDHTRSAEVGTSFIEHGYLINEWLPRRHRVGPSASLDEQIRQLFEFYNMMKQGCQI